MKTIKLDRLFFLIAGTILFDLLFRKHAFGLNILLFTILIAVELLVYHVKEMKNKVGIALGVGAFLFALSIVLHGSTIGLVFIFPALFVWVAAVHAPQLKSLPYLTWFTLDSLVRKPQELKDDFALLSSSKKSSRTFKHFLKITIIPLIILAIFYAIFLEANPKFAELSDRLFGHFFERIAEFLQNLSFLQFIFYVLGFFIGTFVLYKRKNAPIQENESKLNDTLIRQRTKAKPNSMRINKAKGILSPLKTDYQSAFVTVLMLNLLLLVVNGIDLNWVWLNFSYDANLNLTQFVHSGTWLLILSIILSMSIMLYFFRGNLNFYSKNWLLKINVYAWIIQNMFLTLSVAMRNYRYIAEYGLAYKRVWLLAFLFAVIIGLISLIIKIKERKSGFYLIKLNSWAIYAIFALISLINWDMTIARYNLSGNVKQPLDVNFLLDMSPQVYPRIEQSGIKLETLDYYDYLDVESAIMVFDERKSEFIRQEKENSWLSYNLDSRKAFNYFEKNTENQ